MGQSYHYNNQQLQQHQHQQQASGPSRWGLKTSGGGGVGGEIVEVQGGHIVRSTSRKDRHSKVCTAKGARDRRVRLSAHTAIQFYDVQDRLGYDRPSKAVDWLIEKAKTAIDKLEELPPWKPTATTVTKIQNPDSTSVANFNQNPGQLNQQQIDDSIGNNMVNPMGNGNSVNSQRSQDLRLSLQSLQDPLLHNHQQQTQQNNNSNIYFDGSGGFVFSSQPPAAPFLQPFFGQTVTSELFNNSSQREPLQSSIAPSFRGWNDPLPPFTGVAMDQHPTLGFHRPVSGLGGFSGFGFPARMQGGEEERDGVSDRPSSGSSESRH